MTCKVSTQSAIGVMALAAASLVANAGTVVSWGAVANGSWGNASNWTPMMVPGVSDDVVIGHSGFYAVSVNGLESAADVSITNVDAFLDINSAHALSIFGNLDNEGTVVINPVSAGSLTTLYFDNNANITGSGSIRLNGFGPRARITSGVGRVVTNGQFHTIEGFGQIEAGLVNEGLVSANMIGNELSLRTNSMQNNMFMEAVDGGVLNISGITVTHSGSGEIRAVGADSEVRLTGSTILGGKLLSSLGGEIDVTNASTLDDVEADADLRVKNSHVLNIRNSIINNGEILVNPVSGDSETSLVFLDSSSLEGSGAVTLNGFGVRANLKADETLIVTNTSNHTIQGKGQIEASLINEGVVSANVVAEELVLMTYPKVNVSTMEAVDGAILTIAGTTVMQSSGPVFGEGPEEFGVIVADGLDSTIQIAGSEIVNGSVETHNDAMVVITCATIFDNVAFAGDLNILNSHRLIMREGTTNDGMIMVNPAGGEGVTFVEWGNEMVLEGEGVIRLAASGPRSQLIASEGVEFGELGSNQRLEGIGEIALNLINSGEIAPGLSVGMMSAVEPVFLSDTSVFEAEISPADSDLLRSVSTIELGGDLEVVFIDGFMPEGYWARTIMEGSSITDEFDMLDFPAPPAGLVSRLYNTGTEVIIGQTCPLDFDLDGELNFFDVSLFLEAYENQDPIADISEDGFFNFFDISAFLDGYEEGCQVPER
jgi:hypothetical protein